MKKLLLIIILFCLSLFIPAQSFAVINAADYNGTPLPTASVTPGSSVPDMMPFVQGKKTYQLAYPGILPDNFLYKLKVLRDRILLAFITDPVKKVDFYLLQTDKGVAMVPMLVAKNEVSLAKETALKAENNFTELTFVYKKTGLKPTKDMLSKLLEAAKTHQQVLSQIMAKVSQEDAKTFQQVINFSITNVQSLQSIFQATKK